MLNHDPTIPKGNSVYVSILIKALSRNVGISSFSPICQLWEGIVRRMPVNMTPVKNSTKDAPKTTKVGSNKNMLDNEAEWSGDEVEGGTMLMAVEGITDGRAIGAGHGEKIDNGGGGVQALTQLQAHDTTTRTHAPTHTAGVKRTLDKTVSPTTTVKETATGSCQAKLHFDAQT